MINFNDILASVICVIHIIIFLLIFIIPFTNSNYLLFCYITIVPFIEVHWLLNDDTCCLTVLEKYLRGIDDKDCFTNKILSPIYKFPSNNKTVSLLSYTFINLLLSIVVSKLVYKFETKQITSLSDLYVI